ncbi:MAG: hypothetical protein KJO71_04920, partial [Muriicola sp.]|nr:hypothetical protein [Muriicola sp.]
ISNKYKSKKLPQSRELFSLVMFGKIWDFKYAVFLSYLKSLVVKLSILYANRFDSVVWGEHKIDLPSFK